MFLLSAVSGSAWLLLSISGGLSVTRLGVSLFYVRETLSAPSSLPSFHRVQLVFKTTQPITCDLGTTSLLTARRACRRA
jgi:hypothetical protein